MFITWWFAGRGRLLYQHRIAAASLTQLGDLQVSRSRAHRSIFDDARPGADVVRGGLEVGPLGEHLHCCCSPTAASSAPADAPEQPAVSCCCGTYDACCASAILQQTSARSPPPVCCLRGPVPASLQKACDKTPSACFSSVSPASRKVSV